MTDVTAGRDHEAFVITSSPTTMENGMPLLPKEPADLALAPVAVNIDRNLAPLRDTSLEEIRFDVALQLNESPARSPEERADQIREVALRQVDMHDWHAEISADFARLRLYGGSVSLDLGLSAAIRRYITDQSTDE